MNKTKILGKAVGIQYQGLTDKTNGTAAGGLNSPLIIGNFKRGQTDKPIFITQSNIRAELGHDTSNPDYMAVQDIVREGVGVYVLRVAAQQTTTEMPAKDPSAPATHTNPPKSAFETEGADQLLMISYDQKILSDIQRTDYESDWYQYYTFPDLTVTMDGETSPPLGKVSEFTSWTSSRLAGERYVTYDEQGNAKAVFNNIVGTNADFDADISAWINKDTTLDPAYPDGLHAIIGYLYNMTDKGKYLEIKFTEKPYHVLSNNNGNKGIVKVGSGHYLVYLESYHP